METVTVKELHQMLGKAIKKGKGDRNVVLSRDDEGNGYHYMFYHLTEVNEELAEEFGLDAENDIIVG